MTHLEELKEFMESANREELLFLMAAMYGITKDRNKRQQFMKNFAPYTKGELKRTIRTFRKMQAERPEMSKTTEKIIRSIRCDILHKAVKEAII